MPGFNYGGVGDGTPWSSERGNGPEPGGGGRGNAGDRDNSGNNSSGAASPAQQQIIAIQNDPVIRKKLSGMILAARSINPAAKLKIERISPTGTMSLSITGLNADQARALGLGGLVMGIYGDNLSVAFGDIETGHKISGTANNTAGASPIQIENSVAGRYLSVIQGVIPAGYWLSNGKVVTEVYETIISGGGGKNRNENIRTVRVIRENPQLTEAYNEGLRIQQESAARIQAEVDARAREKALAEEEARARAAGIGKEEFGARKAEESALNNVNQAQQRIAQAMQDKAVADQSVVLQESAAQQASNNLNKSITDKDEFYQYNPPHEYGRGWSEAVAVYDRDIAQKQNILNTANNNLNAARNAVAQAIQRIQQGERERAAAAAVLNGARQSLAGILARKEAEASAEQQRQADAAEKAAREAEEAQRAAEQEKASRAWQARQDAAAKLTSPNVQSVRGISAAAPAVSPMLWSVASRGGVALGTDVSGSVLSRIAAALAELRRIAAVSLIGPVAATITGLIWSEKVGIGSDLVPGRDISALMPGDVISLPDETALNLAADTGNGVNMPVRGRLVMLDSGVLETQLVRTPVAGNVPVVRAVLDVETGYWGYVLPSMPGVPGQTILISPADAPGVNGQLTLTGPVPLPEKIMHTGDLDAKFDGITTTISPVADDLDFDDVILIFPADSGLRPLYVMLRSRRNMPGTVDGSGQPVGDNWLGNAGVGEGAPVPSQIADKLRGREFSSFDAFRRAFWKTVADDPELSKQFNQGSLGSLKLGKSPFVRKNERVGGRIKYELHHIKPVSSDGDVYGIDNLSVMTPKRHIEVHVNKVGN
ncbi:S-type pyocin domain-containing protein [Cedecea neteri]|uniref:S-type pyocin domain-containing protein n=1 Tax=Cedecea neteri TaxID=158822 RepID=UPI00289BB27E|nr:S-type pyocin domain-containing protein [Cedecea neteri]